MDPIATIVITTYNRKEELAVCAASALKQDTPCEILIMDDGSTDGTEEMIRTEFPTVRYVRSDRNIGLVAQRSKAARVATGCILFSIDDDAEFSEPTIVREVLAEFDDPRVGALAIPFIDVKQGRDVLQGTPDRKRTFVLPQYIGTAYALRKDLFLSLGGYCDLFYRQLEESDFCIRMLDAGFYVKAGSSRPILHHESPKRVKPLILFYSNRNNLIFAWRNVPWLTFPIHVLATTFNTLRQGIKLGFLKSSIDGIFDSIRLIILGKVERRPVSVRAYLLFRKLRRRRGMFLDAIDLPIGHKHP